MYEVKPCCVALKTFHNLSSFCSPPLPTYVSTLPPAPTAPDPSQFCCSSPPLLQRVGTGLAEHLLRAGPLWWVRPAALILSNNVYIK